MSALGHMQTFGDSKRMSALPPKADIRVARRHVRFGPEAVIDQGSFNIWLTPSGTSRTVLGIFSSRSCVSHLLNDAGMTQNWPALFWKHFAECKFSTSLTAISSSVS
jgi:hypothetical protein